VAIARRLLPWLVPLWLGLLLPAAAVATDARDALAERDAALVATALARMPPARPGQPDLYVVGFAGDGNEHVFGNEVDYLRELMERRFAAGGRTLLLANRPRGRDDGEQPLATLANLRLALAGIAAAMDPAQDLLLLYLTSHGTAKHQLAVSLPGVFDTTISPRQLRAALDDAGIRHRVVVVSACYSGGFIPELQDPGSIVMTAARRDRTSFGCGDTESATYFGRALLIEGMNRDDGLLPAFEYARRQVARREKIDRLTPSEPQLWIGAEALERLQAWEAATTRGPVVPYPHD
jgi:hypothetical protein